MMLLKTGSRISETPQRIAARKSGDQPPRSKKRDGGWRRRYTERGQAMVEFVVALVVILVLVASLMQVGALVHAHTQTMVQARRQAGENAMNDAAYVRSQDAQFIFDWELGEDGLRYTRDDTARTAASLGSNAVDISLWLFDYAHPTELAQLAPANALSALSATPDNMDQFYLVQGEGTAVVTNLPIFRELIYARDTIGLESKAWLAWTEMIY